MKNLILVCLVVWLSSCGLVNKHKSSSSSKIDSTGVSVSKQTDHSSLDSTGGKVTEKQSGTQSEDITHSGLSIKFSTADGSTPTRPVKIKRDTAGNISVDPGGRVIESITQTDNQVKKKARLKIQTTVDTGHVQRQTGTLKAGSTAVNLHKQQNQSESGTTRIKVPLAVYVIGGLIVVALAYLWFTGRLKKKSTGPKVPYSSPNDNTA